MNPTRYVRVERGRLKDALAELSVERRARPRLIDAQRSIYNGVEYASLAEANYARDLDLELKAGVVLAWSRQPRFPIVVNGDLVCHYTADFEVVRPEGREIVEVKGYATSLWKLRMRLFRATVLKVEQPELGFRLVMTGPDKGRRSTQ